MKAMWNFIDGHLLFSTIVISVVLLVLGGCLGLWLTTLIPDRPSIREQLSAIEKRLDAIEAKMPSGAR
jgi:hypothetical protein